MMNIRDAIVIASHRLRPRRITCAADKNLGRLEAEILLAHVLNTDRVWLLAHSDVRLLTLNSRRFERLITQREQHMPIAYILGEKEFYGLPFNVTRDVLIPRPETEMLVELALSSVLANGGGGDVWDVGTGSGCVAITIAKHLPRAQVVATDVDERALAIAKRNARLNRVTHITFLKANMLDANVRRYFEQTHPTFLTIVANLPYLPLSDRRTADVAKYEPPDALFAGKTGRELIETFLRQLAAFDLHFTSIFLEFDSPQSKKLRAFAKELFPRARITIHADLAGRDRVLVISR